MQSLPPARGPHGTKPWCLQPCTTRSDSPALVARRAQFKPCSKSETASLRRTSTMRKPIGGNCWVVSIRTVKST
eukprot:1550893-Pyramimonas_sp.AAC.1